MNTVYNTCCDTYHAPDSELTTVCSSWRWTTLSVPRRFQTSPWDATMRHLTQRRNEAPGPVANLSRAAPRSWRANPVVPNSDREGTPLYRLSESHCKIRWVLSQSCMILLLFLCYVLDFRYFDDTYIFIIPSIFRKPISTSSLSFPLDTVLRTMELKGHGVVVRTICCREVTSADPFYLAMVGRDTRDLNDITDVFFVFVGSFVFFRRNSTKCPDCLLIFRWDNGRFHQELEMSREVQICPVSCFCQVTVRVDLRSPKLIHVDLSARNAELFTKVSCGHSKINGCLQKKIILWYVSVVSSRILSYPLISVRIYWGTWQRGKGCSMMQSLGGSWETEGISINYHILRTLALRCLSTSCYSAYQSHLKDCHLSPIGTTSLTSLKQLVPEKCVILN